MGPDHPPWLFPEHLHSESLQLFFQRRQVCQVIPRLSLVRIPIKYNKGKFKFGKFIGGFSAWSYWFGWSPVLAIYAILIGSYIKGLVPAFSDIPQTLLSLAGWGSGFRVSCFYKLKRAQKRSKSRIYPGCGIAVSP